MNPVLRRFQTVCTVLNYKLPKQWHVVVQTNKKYLSHFIHEPPSSIQKMTQNKQQQNTGLSPPKNSTDYPICKYRQWKTIWNGKPDTQTPGLSFKTVSYNILAQDILLEHLYLYTHSNPNCLKWSNRLARLTEKIHKQRPDILCLQEVQENHLDDIMTNIKSHLPTMTTIFQKKTGTKCDGCAIIYNRELFDLVESNVVEFYRPEINLLDRHNIALIAKLRCKSKKEATFLVSTTHLLFNPNRQDVRLAQVMVLLAELDRHSIVGPGKLERMPVILAGDFNFQPISAPFKLITTGKLCYEGLAQKSLTESTINGTPLIGKSFLSHKMRITDNCQHIDCVENNYMNCAEKVGKLNSTNRTDLTVLIQLHSIDSTPHDPKLFSTGTLTHGLHLKSAYNHFDGISYGSIFQKDWVTVDHLFYSQGDQENPKQGALKLLSVYQLPNVQRCRQMGPIPNEKHGSDHFLLAAQFYLKFSNDEV